MEPKKEFIATLANHLIATKSRITGNDVISRINSTTHTPNRGGKYGPGRGIYKLLHATYDSLIHEGRKSEADNVANAFTNAYGDPAWDK